MASSFIGNAVGKQRARFVVTNAAINDRMLVVRPARRLCSVDPARQPAVIPNSEPIIL
ncbi:hypothetical protein [Burkholderia seminalis]|uniref:hypothetical protein n=1 Tax=Burkholderia seminalis TaxID=488731 RepID=UPI002651B71B|nr:hypothetical protein [Burkholderia seminalis]MDN7587260.1 hypothetical protein [Burkholderia seminalis]